MTALDLSGFFTEREGEWYAELARSIPPRGTLVEVGAWKGLSASYAGPACNARGVRFVLVDHFAGSSDTYAPLYAEELARTDVRATLERNLRQLGIAYELLAMPSREAALCFQPGSVDAVFLDASHDGGSVRADLAAWLPRIREGGTLCGHDLSDDHPELVGEVTRFCVRARLVLERGPDRVWLARVDSPRRGPHPRECR